MALDVGKGPTTELRQVCCKGVFPFWALTLHVTCDNSDTVYVEENRAAALTPGG